MPVILEIIVVLFLSILIKMQIIGQYSFELKQIYTFILAQEHPNLFFTSGKCIDKGDFWNGNTQIQLLVLTFESLVDVLHH